MNGPLLHTLTALALLALATQAFAADGNPARGQRVFGACAACHSLQPDQNMTGPSLADVWNRKAGSTSSFSRYSTSIGRSLSSRCSIKER